MNPSPNNLIKDVLWHLHPALPGMLLAVFTLLFGFGLGIVFGLNEDIIKARLKASTAEVRESVYHGNDATIKAVLDKSWVYMQRAHLHASGLGATALGLILLASLLGQSPGLTRAISLALGAGGLGYSVFWLWAGFRAPALGGTGAAKESLKWLAMPCSGAMVVATAAVAVLLITVIVQRRAAHPSK
ncbi:MAG: hypothetical protein WCV00_19200 [Verrucomicrobiia bacterium]